MRRSQRPCPRPIASGRWRRSEVAAVLAASGAEYIVALVLIASGLQSPEPLWPALAGGLVLVNAAFSGPPLGAFRAVGRSLHRRLDLVVVGVLVVLAALPMLNIDTASRVTMVVVAAVLGVVWWGTNFADSAERRRRRLALVGATGQGRRPEHRPHCRPARTPRPGDVIAQAARA